MLQPRGIIPPLITPFDANGRINYPVMGRLIDILLDKGVHGIFPLGTTGEFYAFDNDEYREVIRYVVQRVNGRVPVYAGANHITTRGVTELVKIAEDAGADAVSVLTPMFVTQTQNELFRYFETIAASASTPIILYNNRPKTNVHIEPATVARLAEIQNIIGVKDSTGDMTNTAEYIRLTRHIDNFNVLVGRDTLIFAGLCYGASGAIATCANVAPGLVVEIYEKFMAGDYKNALEAQFRLAPLRIATNMGTFPQVIKEALEILGIPVGKCLDPICELAPEQHEQLIKVLKSMDLPL